MLFERCLRALEAISSIVDPLIWLSARSFTP
nr:MAG TPA: hypothetical protein [Caudoviricetes sp.]